MTSLEFIEAKIKSTERRIQELRKDQSFAITHNREDEFLDLDSDIEYYENLLNHLQQVKNKLEESEKQSNPTFEECIKMWEEKDFIVDNNKFCIHLEHIQYQVDMFIHKEEKKYHVHYGYISLELNELLTKTLKALEVEDDNN